MQDHVCENVELRHQDISPAAGSSDALQQVWVTVGASATFAQLPKARTKPHGTARADRTLEKTKHAILYYYKHAHYHIITENDHIFIFFYNACLL